MEQYFYYDGANVVGPHTLREIQELYIDKIILETTPIAKAGDKDWNNIHSFIDSMPPLKNELPTIEIQKDNFSDQPCSEDQSVKVKASEEEKISQIEDEEDLKEKRITRHQLLRQIRSELDKLWECQRESIISRIKNIELEKEYEITRKRNREIYQMIETNAFEYWRRSGILNEWISELTWKDADYTRKLRGANEAEKYDDLQQWIDHLQIADYAGCYCFKKGREYLYIGQANILKDRIKQHERKTYFTYSTSVRIVIPKNKRQLNRLERLLILAHCPEDNRNGGVSGNTPADSCLEFIKNEIHNLINDF